MEVLWFCVIALLLVMFAIRDGADLGSGILYLMARSDSDRRIIQAAAGPAWNGNEVWLLLAAAALYYAFPSAYTSRGLCYSLAAVFSLLILRAITSGLPNRIFYGVATLLSAVSFGAAIGFVIPDAPRWFPYLCGLCSLAVLTLDSAAWIALHSTGNLQRQCRQVASGVWWAVVPAYAVLVLAALTSQPHLVDDLMLHSRSASSISIFAVIALAGLIGTRLCLSVGFDLGTFASASCLIAGVLSSLAASQVPQLLNRDLPTSAPGLSAIWWLPAFAIAIGYNLTMSRRIRQKIALP
ncbi:MAG TPA: cytochrome d ubiquinol oxidase subunit II [Bryobacteraceae bacterium]|jgi:cytochrome d ubiquinol oxidase subunit II